MPPALPAHFNEAENEKQEDLETEFQDDQALEAKLNAQQQMDRLRTLRNNDQQTDPRAAAQDEMRKTAKVAIRRGVEYAFNLIAGAFNVTIVAFIATFFIHGFTLIDLNIQMIYGYYIAKDKSALFPALKWAPLRVPLPDIMLHAGVVFVDVLLFMMVGVVGLAAFIIIFEPQALVGFSWDLFEKYVTDPVYRAAINQAATSAIK